MFSAWQTTWLLQAYGKMLHLPKLILTIDDTIGYAKRDTWCQDVKQQIGDVAGPHTC